MVQGSGENGGLDEIGLGWVLKQLLLFRKAGSDADDAGPWTTLGVAGR